MKKMNETMSQLNFEAGFNENSQKEVRGLFQDEKNEYIMFLRDVLKKNPAIISQLRTLAEYGLSRVKNKVENFALADFFFRK